MISRDEWLRLRSAARGGDQTLPQPVSDRKERHERSKAIVKNWENTIEVKKSITRRVINVTTLLTFDRPVRLGPATEEAPS